MSEDEDQNLIPSDRDPLFKYGSTIKVQREEEMQEQQGQIGVSRQILLNVEDLGKAKRAPQYIAALSVTLGALATGTLLSWTSPAGNVIVDNVSNAGFLITSSNFDWISGLMPLGAAAVCLPIAILMDAIGRKVSMLSLIVLFTISWGLIIWGTSVTMLFIGRFLGGIAGGAFCVSAPLYSSEIAEKEIRGALGSYFQLMVTVGILVDYTCGAFASLNLLNYIGLAIPFIFGVCFFFQPETPVYYIKKGKIEQARRSLRHFRGNDYDYNTELQQLVAAEEVAKSNPISFSQSLRKTATKKAITISFLLMLFQQFSGVNAIIFFMGSIFKNYEASLPFSPDVGTVIVGVIQVIATLISSMIVDNLGRKILLFISSLVMGICTVCLGIFNKMDSSFQDNFFFIPVALIAIFIILFSLGFGPIPWMIAGELIPQEAKSIASSLACTFNWILAFLVTMFFRKLNDALGISNTFILFGAISLTGAAFVFFFVPETKGKTLQEMEIILSGGKVSKNERYPDTFSSVITK